DGTYQLGSLEGIKQSLRDAVANGELENTSMEFPVLDEAGNPVVDEEGNPVMETKTVLDLIDGLTEGEALLATQAAIWSYSNGSYNVQSGKDGMTIIDPDGYKWNHLASETGKFSNGECMDDYGSARVDFLYTWLINLDTEENSTVVINEQNHFEDMTLTVGEQVGEEEAVDENGETVTNGIYETALNFTLAFIPTENDDLLMQLKYTDADGIEHVVVRRLAGENEEGEDYSTILPDENGTYTISGLKLSENKEFNFDLRLEGTQYLENGVYVYQAVGGREESQTMVGIAQGEREVDISVGMTVEFSVDEKENVVIKNTGSTDAYIRARIVGNWVSNEDNTTIVQAWDPDGDGEFNGLPGTNWEKSGDYYYYKLPVAPDQQTESPLFNYYTVTESVEDAHLVMDILVQAIQSEAGAAQDAWGVDPSNPNQQ
ncbi:MAG: thioester domain-containing protein, partial [Firmicutes bacterium]|nr:thioester domain-containing protein [Bacillota bacterium]